MKDYIERLAQLAENIELIDEKMSNCNDDKELRKLKEIKNAAMMNYYEYKVSIFDENKIDMNNIEQLSLLSHEANYKNCLAEFNKRHTKANQKSVDIALLKYYKCKSDLLDKYVINSVSDVIIQSNIKQIILLDKRLYSLKDKLDKTSKMNFVTRMKIIINMEEIFKELLSIKKWIFFNNNIIELLNEEEKGYLHQTYCNQKLLLEENERTVIPKRKLINEISDNYNEYDACIAYMVDKYVLKKEEAINYVIKHNK